MAEKSMPNNREAKLARIIYGVSTGPEYSRIAQLNRLVSVLARDRESFNAVLRKPEWLRIAVTTDESRYGFRALAHGIGYFMPVESLVLFDLVRMNRSEYLPILASKEGMNGSTVGALIVIGAIRKDMEMRIAKRVNQLSDTMLRRAQEQIRALSPDDTLMVVLDPKRDLGVGESSEIKRRIVGVLRDNPELRSILKMVYSREGFSIAHAMSGDEYLAGEMIDMIKDKPFFLEIMLLRGQDEQLIRSIAVKCPGQLIEALERAPPDVAKAILEERIDVEDVGHIYPAHLLLADGHFSNRLDALLRSNNAFESIYDLEMQRSSGDESCTVRQAMRKIAEARRLRTQ